MVRGYGRGRNLSTKDLTPPRERLDPSACASRQTQVVPQDLIERRDRRLGRTLSDLPVRSEVVGIETAVPNK
jgi:hypothetical protein